jgi:hypothetical protein
MSDQKDEGGQLVPKKKKPDQDEQLQLRISIGLAALILAQALAEGNRWALMIGLTLALKAWMLKRRMMND